MIFVSHSVPHVKDMCNRVLFLNSGRLVYDGEPEKGLKMYEQLGKDRNPGFSSNQNDI